MIPTLGLMAAGFGICAAVVIALAVVVDVAFVLTGRPTISRRCINAATRYPAIAALVSAVLALVLGMLIGHLFMGQATPTACSCRPGATCDGKCPEPCPCRPTVAAQIGDASVAAEALDPEAIGQVLDAEVLGQVLDAQVLEIEALEPARATQPVPDGKPVLLGFKQKINPVCIKMQRELERRPDVKTAIAKAYDVRLYDWTKDKDQCDKYAVNDVPTCIVLDAAGKEVKRFVGYKSPNELLRWLGLPCP